MKLMKAARTYNLQFELFFT